LALDAHVGASRVLDRAIAVDDDLVLGAHAEARRPLDRDLDPFRARLRRCPGTERGEQQQKASDHLKITVDGPRSDWRRFETVSASRITRRTFNPRIFFTSPSE